MKKLICDRCGEEYAPLPDYVQAPKYEYRVEYIATIPFFIRYVDLCDDCKKDFEKWLLEKRRRKEEAE